MVPNCPYKLGLKRLAVVTKHIGPVREHLLSPGLESHGLPPRHRNVLLSDTTPASTQSVANTHKRTLVHTHLDVYCYELIDAVRELLH